MVLLMRRRRFAGDPGQSPADASAHTRGQAQTALRYAQQALASGSCERVGRFLADAEGLSSQAIAHAQDAGRHDLEQVARTVHEAVRRHWDRAFLRGCVRPRRVVGGGDR